MDKSKATALLIFVSLMISSSAQAQSNCTALPSNSSNRVYSTCTPLPVLNYFLLWTYHPTNHTVDIAYRHSGVTSSDWVAWALNPTGSGMIGAQCLVAFQGSNGAMRNYTSPVADYGTTLAEGALSFGVSSISSEMVSGEIIIYATLQLPAGRTSFNHVWQVGPLSGGTPIIHGLANANRASTGTVDFSRGTVEATGGGALSRRQQKDRNIHGVLNVISWGVLMPVGSMVAKYLKVSDPEHPYFSAHSFNSAHPAWFYIHVTCQTSAYIIGVAGWATGFKLGEQSALDTSLHRNIGITLLCLGTLLASALLLRPKKDSKSRDCWNLCHRGVGYAVISLSIVNIFEGFDLLNVAKGWRLAYIGVLVLIVRVGFIWNIFSL